jgi:glucose/arabinose dehydrogenase
MTYPIHKNLGQLAILLFLLCSSSLWAQRAIRLTQFATGLTMPTFIANANDGSGRLFVGEQNGRIKIVKNGSVLATPFLDISGKVSCCSERGLLGIAFPPGYATSKRFYVNYTDIAGNTVISLFRASANPDVADPLSEDVVLTQQQPFSNHNGGQLAFGPDGYLYIGLGDGGSSNDPLGNGQNTNTLLGKVLRIDVESAPGSYSIPPTNPFVGVSGVLPEIWALGTRNPWRFSFDRANGNLYIADVGQNQYEEVNFQPAGNPGGQNYGWVVMEGMHCVQPGCSTAGLTLPVTEYTHGADCSITGGYVFRGPGSPSLQGVYLYGDYCSGRIRGLVNNGGVWESTLLLDSRNAISTFGEDEAGNVYVNDYDSGTIFKISASRSRLGE